MIRDVFQLRSSLELPLRLLKKSILIRDVFQLRNNLELPLKVVEGIDLD